MTLRKKVLFIMGCFVFLLFKIQYSFATDGLAHLSVTFSEVKNNHLRKCSSSLQTCTLPITTQNSGCTQGILSITNNSNISAINITASSTDPNFINFVIQNNGCPTSLAPGATCSIAFSTTTPATFAISNVMIKGTNTAASFFNIQAFICGFSIGGTVTGLAGTVVLQNNGSDTLALNANGSFTFPTLVPPGGSYNVTILQQPTGQTCTVLNGSGTNVMANVNNVIVSCRGLFAYVGDTTSNLWQCPINIATGSFSGSCAALTNAFFHVVAATFATFSGTTYAYVTDDSANLWQCPINMATGGFSAPCTALTNTPAFTNTFATTFATFAGTTYAYVADASNTLWQCPINTATGSFSGLCAALTNTPAFSLILHASFATFSGTTYAYVADGSNTLWQCPINTATGGFSGLCTALTNTPAFLQVASATFATFSGTTYAYVGDNNSTLWQCPIDTVTGGFSGTCTALTNGFTATISATFATFAGTTYAYVADSDNTLWQCPIDTTTGGFSGPCAAQTNTPAFLATASATFN